MKINRMFTVLVLSVFSWLIAIFGLVGGGYLFINKFEDFKSLIIAFFIVFGSLLLAVIIRMFGNIGQILFDIKGIIYSLNQDLKTQLQTQTATLSNELQALAQQTVAFSQDLKTQLQTQTATLSNELQALAQQTVAFSQDLKTQLQNNSNTLMQSFQELKQNFSSALQTLQNSLELISCDSKDINQNIHQIKTFFEQIERHLDLKK